MKERNEAMEAPRTPPQISRRCFLKGIAALTGSVVAAGLVNTPERAFASGPTGSPDRFGMLTDFTRCIGCRSCEAACNEANRLPAPAKPFKDESVFEEHRHLTAGAYTVVNRYEGGKGGRPIYRKVQCNHCEEPACASACLVGALKKSPEGPVTYNADVCIGCRYCMVACPFHVPAYDYASALEPKVTKCTMCAGRISRGLVPACAEACPVEAISFGKRSQLISIARDRIKAEPNRYQNHIYGEREAGGTAWLYLSAVPFEELGFPGPKEVGTTAYPEFTKDFLSTVPLVLVGWPALFGGIYMMTRGQGKGEGAATVHPENEEDR